MISHVEFWQTFDSFWCPELIPFLIQQRRKEADMPSLQAMVSQYFFIALNLCCFYTNNFNTFLSSFKTNKDSY